MMQEAGRSKVLYVGEGGNDYCAAVALRAGDTVLVRVGFRLERKLQSRWAMPKMVISATHPLRIPYGISVVLYVCFLNSTATQLILDSMVSICSEALAKVQADILYWETYADLRTLLSTASEI